MFYHVLCFMLMFYIYFFNFKLFVFCIEKLQNFTTLLRLVIHSFRFVGLIIVLDVVVELFLSIDVIM